MILIQKLVLNLHKSIDIVMPSVEDKFNTYYQPTNDLNRFDEIFFILKEKDKEVIVVSESAEYVIDITKPVLELALKDALILPKAITVGDLGRNYNISTYNAINDGIDDDTDYTHLSLCAGGFTRTNLHTFMYNKDNKIYLEIAPVYPWIWDEPGTVTDSNHITFDEFMETYKPIAVEELDHTTVQRWIEQCNEILGIMVTGLQS